MAVKATHVVARLAWLAPLFLAFLVFNQTNVALDLRHTLRQGRPATAEVLEVHEENRVDVTYDYVSLRVALPGGQVIERDRLSLPHTLIPAMEGRETVGVHVLPGADQEVVITELADTQWRIAALNALMSGIAALLFGGGVFAWNRHLRRSGDPAHRSLDEGDEPHPAARHVRAS